MKMAESGRNNWIGRKPSDRSKSVDSPKFVCNPKLVFCYLRKFDKKTPRKFRSIGRNVFLIPKVVELKKTCCYSIGINWSRLRSNWSRLA